VSLEHPITAIVRPSPTCPSPTCRSNQPVMLPDALRESLAARSDDVVEESRSDDQDERGGMRTEPDHIGDAINTLTAAARGARTIGSGMWNESEVPVDLARTPAMS
jgi:hypothetical protein